MNRQVLIYILVSIVILCIVSKIMVGSFNFVKLFTAYVKPENITDQLTKSGSYQKRSLNDITDITVHHSASLNGEPEAYARHHVYNNGWPGIGYHYVIQPDGKIYQVNELDSVSYHNGYNNTNAIGICLTGNFNIEDPKKAQLVSLRKLIRNLKIKIPSIKYVVGHKQVTSTSCPGQYMDLDSLRKLTLSKNRSL